MLHPRKFERVRLEHGDARRQVTQCAVAQLRGDHDFVERLIRRRRDCDKQEWNRARGAQQEVHPYPSAGINRIRFYGFAANPHLRPAQYALATPRRGG
jgi:hypothetical protein